MLKIINLVVLFVLIISSISFAQSSFESNTNLLISLKRGLIIQNVSGDLDFGEVITSSSSQNLTTDPQFGVLFEVTGEPREAIIINYSNNVVLNNSSWLSANTGNYDEIEFQPNVRHTRANSSYINSRNLRNGRTIRLRNSGGFGKLFIWLGGDIDINPNQEAGVYEGTFNITVAY